MDSTMPWNMAWTESYNVIYEEEDDEQNKLRLAAENWKMPVIVTTAVCFFESLFHNKPSNAERFTILPIA